jgi:hypothetical protein
MLTTILVAGLALATLLAGCCGKDEEKQAALAPGGDPAYLELIPAETPYVMAAYARMPQDVVEAMFVKFGPVYDKSLETWAAQIAAAQLARSAQAAAVATDPNAPAPPPSIEDIGLKVVSALLDELKGNFSVAGFAKLGLSTQPLFAVYGIGVLPAIRLELKDPALFNAMIDRVQAKSGVTLDKGEVGGQAYRTFTYEEAKIAFATQGNELLVTAGNDAALAAVLPVLFGQQKPEKSLAASGALKKLMDDYGFKPYVLGYVDTKIVAATLMGDGQGLNAKVLATLGAEIPPLSPVCKTEINGLVDNAPRAVLGYDELTASSMTVRAIVELKPELATALKDLRAPVAGLSEQVEGTPLIALGLGLDVQKVMEFAKGKAAAVGAAPYQCELLAELNNTASEIAGSLASPQIPPVVTTLKGFNLYIQDGSLEGGAPKDLKAVATVGTANPMVIVAMAQGMIPDLATLKIDASGTPAPLPPIASVPLLAGAQVAVKDTTLALSVGEGMGAKLTQLVDAKPAADAPLLVVAYDAGSFMQKMASVTDALGGAMPPEAKAEFDRSMALNAELSKLMGMSVNSVLLGDRGITFKQKVAIK